jgi:LysR family transcriptional regulator, transcriptional activator for dmlA
MSLLDDTAIFVAVVQQGGFGRAARSLGLSNGLISRRIAQMEAQLGVTLLKRTTRQLQMTPEGELFWQHAQRIQQELDSALCLIGSLAEKPKGSIRISAPPYFGRHYLIPIINKFMTNFDDINIDLILTDKFTDPVKEKIDLLIRGTGYFDSALKDSSMKIKLLTQQTINLYASQEYLVKHGEPKVPEDLLKHSLIGFINEGNSSEFDSWSYTYKNKKSSITFKPKFNSNDMDSRAAICMAGQGIGKFTALVSQQSPPHQTIRPILEEYDWGKFNIYVVYVQQHALPRRTRLLIDFISAHTQNIAKLTP